MTKLTIAQVRDIKFGNATTAVLKIRHKVTQQTIYDIRKGQTWKHVKPSTEVRCNHTPCPIGYLAWHNWAQVKRRTHKQRKCGKCGLYKIWVKKQ